MAQEHNIGLLAQIPQGEGRNFEIEGERIAVFHTRTGEVFAVQADCPHRIGPLADGLVGGTTVICPLHERTFNLRTGAGIGHDDCIKSYQVKIGDGATVVLLR